MIIKEYSNATKKTVTIGIVEIDFQQGQLTGGDQEIFDRIKTYFEDGMSGNETYRHLVSIGLDKKEARSSANFGKGVFSLHAQSPGYELTDPFHDKSQFKALISCMGWHSDDLADVDMPESTWEKYPDDPPEVGIEVLN